MELLPLTMDTAGLAVTVAVLSAAVSFLTLPVWRMAELVWRILSELRTEPVDAASLLPVRPVPVLRLVPVSRLP